MKFFAAVASLAFALVSTTSAGPCTAADLGSGLSPLSTPASSCQTSTGYRIFVASAQPTPEQLKKVCTLCKDVFTAAESVAFPVCTIAVGGTPTNIGQFFTDLTRQCSNTTTTPSGTTKPPLPPTASPAVTTETPIATTTAPPVVTTKAPEATTTAPAVTPPPRSTTKPTDTPAASNSTEPPVIAAPTAAPDVSPTPTPVPINANSGLSTTTIVAAGGGGVLAIALVSVILVLLRRRRKDKLDRPASQPPQTNSFVSADLSDAYTDDTLSGSDLLRGEFALAAVRIRPDDLQLGTVVSHGGFGEVIHGVYRNEAVAVKRLLASRRKEPHSIRSFFKEIQLTASLDHACIVRFIGVAWDVPANLMMVSEFMHGGDLRSLLVRYTREHHAHGHDDGKLRMAVQIAHAMTYLHSLDTPVVHRDLKSRNILLTESLDAKVIDFGISCERQDATMTAGVGTSLWMAPEVMLGKRYDEKADVFSFGVILSELDTHALPYDHARDTSSNRKMADMVVMQLICDGKLKPRFTEMADPNMVALARDCLEVDPAKRPRASQVLYRIHNSRQHDRTLTTATRSAMENSLYTVETRATTQYSTRY